MSIIPESSVEEVRSLVDIVDVVGEYVQLKKRSSNFVGLCPFHSEKTPSFNVNPRLGIFKCFGCGEGGDVFSFVSRMESLSFPEAVRVLSDRVGVVLPEEEAPADGASESESIYHSLRFAARFFHDRLTKDPGAQTARDYLQKRGFTKESIKKFGIGYAPDEWDVLVNEARANHIEEEFLEKAGLVIERKDESGFYDRYRHRLIFPIFSHVGKVVGFGGRILREDDQPKYINSPETKVYSKGRILYGLYHSKNAIRGKEEAILVEGYTDVVSLHQAGVQHVVASSGTALTKDQINAIGRYAKVIILLYDADSAGLRAALRGIDLILEEGLIPYAVRLPDGEDPDSYVQKNGAAAFETYLKEHRQNFIQFVLTNARIAGSMNAPEGVASVQRTILQSVARIADPLNREAYLRSAALSLDIPDNELRPIVEGYIKGGKSTYKRPAVANSERERTVRNLGPALDEPHVVLQPTPAEKKLLRLMLEDGPRMINWIMSRMALTDFTLGPSRQLADELVRQYSEKRFNRANFLSPNTPEPIRLLASEVMTTTEEPSDNWGKRLINVPKLDEDALKSAASSMKFLKRHRLDEQIASVRKQVLRAQESGSDPRELQINLNKLYQIGKHIDSGSFLEGPKY
ncbi:MAG: DNA primase [Bacteroidetes bacterium]|nr:DNA primase [Bacteroidota bacterium]